MRKKIKYIATIFAFMILMLICNKVYAVEITETLTNAPYNNSSYCESMLPIQSFNVVQSSSNSGTASNYPTVLTFGAGSYNETSHTYTKTCQIDFSGTTFSEYGDYLFELTSVGDTGKYYVNVFVDNTGYTVDSLVGVGDISGKESNPNITIPNPNTYIKIDKQVKGDIADLSKDFTFNVKIDGYTGDTYTVVKPDSTTDTYTVARTGTEVTGVNYTIGHNENLTIGKNGTTMQIPVGTNYTITETSDGYTTTYKYINRAGATEQTGAVVTDVAMETDTDNEVKFINTKNAEATTGVFYNVLPFMAVIILAVVGIVLMKKTKNK